MARPDSPLRQPRPRGVRRDTIKAIVVLAMIVTFVVGLTLHQRARDRSYADAASAEAAQEAARQARLRAWYQTALKHAATPDDRLDFCMQRIYEQLPFAAPAQVLAITSARVDAYFYLTENRHVPRHLACSGEGLEEDDTTPHPYGVLLTNEAETRAERPNFPYQNLWSEASHALRQQPAAEILELFVRPDTGELVIRSWTRGERGWVEDLQPADAPRPGLAATRSALGDTALQ